MSTATPPIEPHAGTDPNSLGALDQRTRTALQLSPGETDAIGAKFTPSLTTPWLTGAMAVTSTRLVYRIPNTVLGFIPAGSQSNTVPISSIAAVSTNTRLRLGSIILGLILLIAGIATMGNVPVLGVLCLLLGVVNFLVAFPASLAIQNNAGGIQAITVSMLEKARLDAFAQEVNNRVFADRDQLRHEQSLAQSQMQTLLQQQMLMQQQNLAMGQANGMMQQPQQMQMQQPQQMPYAQGDTQMPPLPPTQQ